MTNIPIVIASLNRKLAFFAGAACEGPGLASGRFDLATGEIDIIDTRPSIDNPGFLAMHPKYPCVYVATEVHDWEEGVVTSVALDPETLKLTYLNKQVTLGGCTSHCSLDRTGRFLLVTNYRIGDPDRLPGMSVICFPVGSDGALKPAISAMPLQGTGPVANRQEQAHAHCIFATPDNRNVIVADLGADRLISIPFDERTGTFAPQGTRASIVPPGSGPRHFLIHPTEPRIYLLNELSGTLMWFDLETDGNTALRGTVTTRHDGACGHNDASDLAMTPDGQYLYAANRGDDTVAIFAIEADGSLTPRGHQSVMGHWPRNLAIDPGGNFLLVSNQYSDTIAVFAIDAQHGQLHHMRNVVHNTPMCIKFPDGSNQKWLGKTAQAV